MKHGAKNRSNIRKILNKNNNYYYYYYYHIMLVFGHGVGRHSLRRKTRDFIHLMLFIRAPRFLHTKPRCAGVYACMVGLSNCCTLSQLRRKLHTMPSHTGERAGYVTAASVGVYLTQLSAD